MQIYWLIKKLDKTVPFSTYWEPCLFIHIFSVQILLSLLLGAVYVVAGEFDQGRVKTNTNRFRNNNKKKKREKKEKKQHGTQEHHTPEGRIRFKNPGEFLPSKTKNLFPFIKFWVTCHASAPVMAKAGCSISSETESLIPFPPIVKHMRLPHLHSSYP